MTIMKPPDNDDDPFHHLMSWDVDQPSSMKKDDENDDSSSDADTDNVIVEDASTDEEEEEEEGNDDQDNVGVNDEVKRSFVVQELFPASVPVAADDTTDGGDTEAVSPSSQFNPTESTIDIATVAQDGTQLVPNSDPNNDGLTAERQVDYVDSIFDAAAVVECDAKEVSNPFDFHVGGSAMQQQDVVPGAPVAMPVTAPVDTLTASPVAAPDASLFALPVAVPTETKALIDNEGVDEIDNHDQKADDLLLSIFDEEAVVSNHQQTCPLEIAPWQQEQSPQQQQQDVLVQENVQENLLDIPLPTYDHSHSYRDFQPPVESLVESVADTNVGDTITDNRLHNPTDVTVTTAAMTTVASTNVNDKMEEDSWATQIPSAYDNNAEDNRDAHGSNEVGPTRRDLEENYAIGSELTSANNNYAFDEERNYLDGHKVSRKKKGKKRDRVKRTNVNDFDEEHAVHVLPGMVAYTQLNEQADEYGRVHSKKSRSKTPYKQQRRKRRCTAMLCILVIVLLATVVGLIYYLIASPSAKGTAGNNGNGQVKLGGGSEEGGNLSDTAVSVSDTTQDSVGGGVHDGHIPSKAPTYDFNHDLNTTLEASDHGVTGSTNGNGTMMVDNNEHHIQHDTSSDISENPGNHSSTETILDGSQHAISSDNTTSSGNHSSTATETEPDESPIVLNNATDSLLLSDSSTLSPTATDTIDEDVHHFENTSSVNTGGDLSLTTTHGEALVSGISKSYGIVFDVESRVAALTITGMDLYLDTSFSSRYEVWLAQGSWKDGAEFVEIAHGTIDGTGVCHDVHLDNCEFAPIPSDEFDSTTITIGQRKSFWVTLRDDDLVSRNRFVSHGQDYGIDLKGVDAVYATNTEMNVYYGTSILTYPIQLADPETDYRSGRGFIGKIRYKVGGTPDNLADPFDIVQHTKTPVMQPSEIPSAQPSSSPTNTTPQDQLVNDIVESCHYVTEESCREAASSLGLHLGGVGFPFAGPYSRSGCYFYSCSNCLYGGIAYFGTKGTVSDFQSTLPVHSEKRLDCNTNLYSIEDDSPFWCLFPTKKCAGC